MSSVRNEITNYTDFDTSKLTFTKLEENDRTNGQQIGYPRYVINNVEVPLCVQLPWINISTYGVPSVNQYTKNDKERSHLKLPLDLNNSEVLEFVNKIKELDAKMSDPAMMEELLGKKSKKYKYMPIYREGYTANDDDDDDDNDKSKRQQTGPRPPYIKIKLNTSYPDGEIKTSVFESDHDVTTNKRIRTRFENINCVNDFAAIVAWKSDVRCIAKPFKCWAQSLKTKDPQFGVSWRLERIEVKKSSMKSSYNSAFESDNFVDSDTEDELPKINQVSITQTSALSNAPTEKSLTLSKPVDNSDKFNEDDSDGNSDSDSDNSSEDDSSTKADNQYSVEVNNKQVTPVVELDSSDEEEVVIKKKPVVKEKKVAAKSSKK